MGTLIAVGILVASIFCLIKSADLIEETFVYISKKLKVSEFFLGFFVLSIVSSLPELAIAVNSAQTAPELSLGNLLGATLILMTLVVGMSAIRFQSVNFQGRFREREMIGGLIVILMSVVFVFDRKLEIWEGVFMIIAYLALIADVRKQFTHKKLEELKQEVPAEKMYKLLVKSLVGTVILLIASNLAVDSVIKIAEDLEISSAIIGLFVLAIGTNTPELTLMFRSKNSDQSKLAIGNFIGSAVFNTPTLGLLTILSGGFEIKNFEGLVPVMVIITFASFLFLLFSWTGRKITHIEGAMLVGVYLSLVITEVILLLN
jgi:cation:H+ antiporter